jgi:hypothetical protein
MFFFVKTINIGKPNQPKLKNNVQQGYKQNKIMVLLHKVLPSTVQVFQNDVKLVFS